MKRIVVLAIAVTIFMAIVVSSVSAPYPSGMIGYWKLDETMGTTAYDYVGIYDGTNYGATINQPGQVGKAYSFDGVDDYVDCGDITELNSASEFTVVGWFKDDDIGGHNRHFDKGLGHIPPYKNDISGATYQNKLYIEVGNTANTYAYWSGYSSVISAGEWYHAAFVFNGSGATNADKAKIYVNGVERTLTFAGTMPTSTADLSSYPFTISKSSVTGNPWNGDIDEVAIFNRALSSSEISSYYDLGLAGHGLCWPPPVGGFWTPINKLELLAPYIGLASLIAVATISIVYLKHRKKKQT